MAFTVTEFRDLVRILRVEPEWREELRRLVLTDELMKLPAKVEILDDKVEVLTDKVEALDTKVESLDARVASFESWTHQRFDEVDKRFDRVDRRFDRIENDLGSLKGNDLEDRYRARPHAYFNKIVRKAQAVPITDLWAMLEPAIEQQKITKAEADDISLSDVIARGVSLRDEQLVYLVAEVSWGIGMADVERAARRATLLMRLGVPVLAVAAGERVIPEALAEAKVADVWLVTNSATIAPT